MSLPKNEAFAFAGLWDINFVGDIPYCSYTVITTVATGLMAEIHNSTLRMPMIVSRDFESEWLNGGELRIDKNQKIDNDLIVATKIGKPTRPLQKQLFY